MISEGKFQSIVAGELRMLPRCVVLNKQGVFTEGTGWPDLFVWEPRWTGLLELKVRAPASKIQQDRIAMLRRAGADARICRLRPGEGEAYQIDATSVAERFVPSCLDYSKKNPRRAVERLEFLAATRGKTEFVQGNLSPR